MHCICKLRIPPTAFTVSLSAIILATGQVMAVALVVGATWESMGGEDMGQL